MKARDIIPGWPRGRSTSAPCARGIPESVHRATKRIGWGEYQRYQDYMAGRAEERRKFGMMEVYWCEQMDLACGKIPSTWDDCFRWWYEEGYHSEADRKIVRGRLP